MIIALLDRYLPVELTDKIFKILHEMYMRDLRKIINHKIVFTLYDNNRISFLVCEQQNYYQVLDNNQFAVLIY